MPAAPRDGDQHAAAAVHGLVVVEPELRHRALAAHHPRFAGLAGAFRLEPEHPPGPRRRLHAPQPQRERVARMHSDLVADQVPGGLADEDLAFTRLVVELGADVGRVAERHLPTAVLPAEQPRQRHLAGVHRAVDPQLHSPLRDLPVELRHRRVHGQGRADGAERVVHARLRPAEHRQHAVAHVVLDRPALLEDGLVDDLVVALDHPWHRLRAQPLAQAGGARQVDVEQGHGPVAGRQWLRRLLQLGPAAVTEPCAGPVRLATFDTGDPVGHAGTPQRPQVVIKHMVWVLPAHRRRFLSCLLTSPNAIAMPSRKGMTEVPV